jgi:hypothetical protein
MVQNLATDLREYGETNRNINWQITIKPERKSNFNKDQRNYDQAEKWEERKNRVEGLNSTSTWVKALLLLSLVILNQVRVVGFERAAQDGLTVD